jgi:hypothetical protein
MNKTIYSLGLALAFCLGILVGASVLDTGAAQQPPMPNPTSPANGRYQLTVANNGNNLFLLDTATGRAWAKYAINNDWEDLKTLPSQEGKK